MKYVIYLLLSTSSTILFGQQCAQEVSEFNTSTINTLVSPLDLWWDGYNPGFEYPKGGGVHAMYTGGFWISGYVADTIRAAAQFYNRALGRETHEFKEGPSGAIDSLYFCDVFRITRSAVDQHLADLSDGQLDNPIAEIINWPGRGNANGPAILMVDEFAPFEDVNGNGIYEPEQGEYPRFVGDQAAWWVVNTVNAPSSYSFPDGAAPWDVELHVLLQAYNEGVSNQLLKTQFLTASLVNRGSTPIDSAALSLRVDAEIGCPLDDAIGSIPELKLMYAYNWDTFDGDGPTGGDCVNDIPTYPGEMPITVTQILSGKTTSPGLQPTYNGWYTFWSGVEPARFPLSEPADRFAPSFFNATHGRLMDGNRLTRGGFGTGGMEQVDWPFDGNPADSSAWSACSLVGLEHRYLLNTNIDQALARNERLTVDYAVYIVDSVALPCPSTDLIRDAANEILDFYQEEVSSTQPDLRRTVKSFDVFPNPSTGRITCVLPQGANLKTLEAMDVTGRAVPLQWENQSNEVNAQLSAKGIFFLIATDIDGNRYQSRVVVE